MHHPILVQPEIGARVHHGIAQLEKGITPRILHNLDPLAPILIQEAGPREKERFWEAFLNKANPHTRRAYLQACMKFLDWCHAQGVTDLKEIRPILVASYREVLIRRHATASVKLALSAIRKLFDHLVTGHVVAFNPAASVENPRESISEGKTPILPSEIVGTFLASFDTSHQVGLRDRALIGIMLFSFARVGAATSMKVKDYFNDGKNWYFRLHEKNGKQLTIPAHHQAQDYLDAYLNAAGMGADREGFLFRSSTGSRDRNQLTTKAFSPKQALKMVKRRCKDAGLPEEFCCHSFRGTACTNYLDNGGDLETARVMMGHAHSKTTRLYNRQNQDVKREEVYRIRY